MNTTDPPELSHLNGEFHELAAEIVHDSTNFRFVMENLNLSLLIGCEIGPILIEFTVRQTGQNCCRNPVKNPVYRDRQYYSRSAHNYATDLPAKLINGGVSNRVWRRANPYHERHSQERQTASGWR